MKTIGQKFNHTVGLRNPTGDVKMAASVKKVKDVLHLKLLYTLTLLLLVAFGAGFYWSYAEIQRLRHEIEVHVKLVDREVFEITDNARNENTLNKSTKNRTILSDNEGEFKNKRGRIKRQTGARDNTGTDDWVWLSSYSRIPIHVLDEFCRSMKDYCPAGKQGPPGKTGKVGEPGPSGRKGNAGVPGVDGAPGHPGVKGDKGQPGVFGLKGDPGLDGTPGKPGIHGPKGERGNKGNPGAPGIPGAIGKKGDRGAKGGPGAPGKDGLDGTPGKPGRPGSKGPKGTRGLLGFPGFKGEPGQVVKTGESISGRAGPPGPAGPPGKDGVPGFPGEPGFNGTDGEPGKRGKKGRTGDPGPMGPKGEMGERGLPGLKGDIGLPGLDGADGMTPNCTCPLGLRGPKGDKGIRGLIGFTGYKGEKGERGPRGPPGYGLTGPVGPKGNHGKPGQKGQKGEPGYTAYRIETSPWTTPTEPTTPSTPPPTIAPRERDCFIEVIGTPLFQRYTGTFWGAWMRDPGPGETNSQKYWYTEHFTGNLLYEYKDAKSYKDDKVDKTYDLKKHHFYGTGHVIYQGSFYYHYTGSNRLVKFNMATEEVERETVVPNAAYSNNQYVYSTEYNYFDFSVDENGLWVVYAQEKSQNSLMVSKLDPNTLEILKTWDLYVNHRSYGNGFITCGVLYLVKSVHTQRTVIDYAFDMYAQKELPVSIRFINPYQMNHMISYNPKEVLIYGWDMGNQITYPLKFY